MRRNFAAAALEGARRGNAAFSSNASASPLVRRPTNRLAALPRDAAAAYDSVSSSCVAAPPRVIVEPPHTHWLHWRAAPPLRGVGIVGGDDCGWRSLDRRFYRSHVGAAERPRRLRRRVDRRASRSPPRTTRTTTRRRREQTPTTMLLPEPTVVYANHHLLVVNKPAGWRSVPNSTSSSPSFSLSSGDGGDNGSAAAPATSTSTTTTTTTKCLLSHLQRMELGGGSDKRFLLPIHRIDQPCTGLLILAKNTKAASRVTSEWKRGHVQKEYLCVVEDRTVDGDGDGLEELIRRSSRPSAGGSGGRGGLSEEEEGGAGYRTLRGILRKRKRGGGVGWSMAASLVPPTAPEVEEDASRRNDRPLPGGGRVCSIEWRRIAPLSSSFAFLRASGVEEDRDRGETGCGRRRRHLLLVKTNAGARHQVRALLGLAGGCPVAGDLRYGGRPPSSSSSFSKFHHHRHGGVVIPPLLEPLSDASVALHARSIYLPTVRLGHMEFLKDRPFVAPIPTAWKRWFGLDEDRVRALLEERGEAGEGEVRS